MALSSYISLYVKKNPPSRDAYYYDVYGTAELLTGSGYLFRPEGERKATLVSYKDPGLVLLGRCDLANAQRADDDAAGGLAALVCGYRKRP